MQHFEAISVYIIPKHKFDGVSTRDIPFNAFAKYPVGSDHMKYIDLSLMLFILKLLIII